MEGGELSQQLPFHSSPQEPCAIFPTPHLLSNPPSMEDGSWAVVRREPHLHTVTRSEGHEGGGGIGVASISLAHPCMAPGLLSAWGGEGQCGDRWDVGMGKRERSDRDIKHQGKREGESDQALPRRAGPRQGCEDGQRQGRGGDRQMMEQRSLMEWECTNPLATSSPAPTRSPLPSYLI